MTKFYLTSFLTQIGEIHIGVLDDAISMVEYNNQNRIDSYLQKLKKHFPDLEVVKAPHPLHKEASKQLQNYFDGQQTHFDLPLNPIGTDFQKSVWKTLRDIPYGQTISYQQEAHNLGKPKSFRAVANANGQNPISIVIPCHRVIGSDGSLSGYGGGVDKKQFLINHEKRE